jgi:hypothetical protein
MSCMCLRGLIPLIEPSFITLCALCLNPNNNLDIVANPVEGKEHCVFSWLIGHNLALSLIGKLLKEICTC